LPQRENINSEFLTLSIENGLNAAIMNTKEITTMNALQGSLRLKGKELKADQQSEEDPLVNLIIRGEKDQLMTFVKEQLREHDPLYVSQNVLAPALEKVGKVYAQGAIYLPHLILAAETVQPAFDYLNSLLGESQVKLGKVLLATVQGDIHDIGKKIVGTVLRSGGFDVYDVGKDVPASDILQACLSYKPDIVGLSAMMTTTVGQVKEVADLLKSKSIDVFLIAGGASMNMQLADEFGVLYAKDAMDALNLCKEFMQKKKGHQQ
jgi:5-methyltetrahydrofolate--homocysteine methyltransferase